MKNISVADFWLAFVVIALLAAVGVAAYTVVSEEIHCNQVLHGTYIQGKCLDVRQLK